MSTITLSANDSHPIPLGGYLRIDAFSVGGAAEPVRVSVNGEQLQANAAGDSCVFLMSCPQRATIVVAPAHGGEFGPDQSTRVTVTRSGASDHRDITVEFPIVRVDGVSEKIIGEIDNTGEHYLLTAYGSDESTNLGRESMVVLSALRSRLTAPTGVTSLVLCPDASATAAQLNDPRMIAGAAHMFTGVATALTLDSVRLGGESCTFDQLAARLEALVGAGATRIGGERPPQVDDHTLVVHLTPTPRAAMVSTGHPSLVLAYGPTAAAEQELFELNLRSGDRTGFVALTDHVLTALEDGSHSAIAPHADTIAAVLSSPTNPHGATE